MYCMEYVAQMAKLVDALVSGASPVKGVEVRVLFWAPILILLHHVIFRLRFFYFTFLLFACFSLADVV